MEQIDLYIELFKQYRSNLQENGDPLYRKSKSDPHLSMILVNMEFEKDVFSTLFVHNDGKKEYDVYVYDQHIESIPSDEETPSPFQLYIFEQIKETIELFFITDREDNNYIKIDKKYQHPDPRIASN